MSRYYKKQYEIYNSTFIAVEIPSSVTGFFLSKCKLKFILIKMQDNDISSTNALENCYRLIKFYCCNYYVSLM